MKKLRFLPKMLIFALVLASATPLEVHADSNADNKAALAKRSDLDETGKMLKTSKTIDGIKYSLTIDLTKWDGYTNVEQFDHIENLFYEVYPQMYKRFGDYKKATTDVTIAIENEGYEIASANSKKNRIHLHDQYLDKHYDHFDVLTHELAHIVHGGFVRDNLEFPKYSEVFADYCRYIYAYKDGRYNDKNWVLPDANTQKTRESSVRFLVWLDKETSSSSRDIIRDFFEVCCMSDFKKEKWGEMWKSLFKGTKFEGKTIDEVWEIYKKSDFAYISAKAPDKDTKSELLKKTDVRNFLRKNSYTFKNK